MSPVERTDVTGLLLEARRVTLGRERLGLCREAVRLADLSNDEKIRLTARLWLIEAATFHGLPEVALVEMAWCLGCVEEHPDWDASFSFVHAVPDRAALVQSDMDVHWALKWVLGSLPEFPEISRKQIDEAFSQARKLYRARGFGMRVLHRLRAIVHREMGDLEEADEERARAWRSPTDDSADCPACELSKEISLLLWDDESEVAILRARPLLDGTLRCRGTRYLFESELLETFLDRGEIREADRLLTRGLATIEDDPEGRFGHLPRVLRFLTRRGQLQKAREIVRRYAATAIGKNSGDTRMQFFAAWRDLIEAGGVGAGGSWGRAELPPELPVAPRGDAYPDAGIHEWLTGEVDRLAAAFDARNGNSWVSETLEAYRRNTS